MPFSEGDSIVTWNLPSYAYWNVLDYPICPQHLRPLLLLLILLRFPWLLLNQISPAAWTSFLLSFCSPFFPQCYLLVVIIPLRHSLKYPLILKIFFPSSSHLPLRSNPIDLFSSLFFRLISCSRVALIVFFSSFLNIKWPVHNLSFLISPFPVNTFVLLVFLSLWLQLRQPASHLILPITHFGQSISRLPNHNNLRSFRFLCV